MDCNSYSYTASGFGVDYKAPLMEIRNDDMEAEIDRHGEYYSVWAYSYDGQLDVYETFNTEHAAQQLYNHIATNYSRTPPSKRELNKAIGATHKIDMKGVQTA